VLEFDDGFQTRDNFADILTSTVMNFNKFHGIDMVEKKKGPSGIDALHGDDSGSGEGSEERHFKELHGDGETAIQVTND
jgi:hypothetical protein